MITEIVEIPLQMVEVNISTVMKISPPRYRKFTLKQAIVEIVEMSEIFSIYLAKDEVPKTINMTLR
jgi:hypothetical protein